MDTRFKKKIWEKVKLFLFLSPTLVFVFGFITFPIIFSGYLSLTKFNYSIDKTPQFIGLNGYIDIILKDGMFHTAFINQIKFAIPYFLVAFFGSLILALLINELKRWVTLFQTIYYMPMIISMSLVGITFGWLLDPNMGLINRALQLSGMGHLTTNWLGNPSTALYSLVLARSWKMLGFTLVVFLGGLASIPGDLREAAKIDGANFWQETVYVVLPNLKPYLLIGGVWVLINSFKVFVLPHVLTQGGPGTSTVTLYYYSWKLAFQRLNMGAASQVAFITAFIILLFSFILNLILGSSD